MQTTHAPYINISEDRMLQTVFDLDLADYRAWFRKERALGLKLASEAFLLSCNPFVHPEVVKNSTSQELNRNAGVVSEPRWWFFRERLDLSRSLQSAPKKKKGSS